MYRTIDAAFWTDPKVRQFKPNDRLFALYLITNPHTHVSGIYYLPWLIAQHETGCPIRALNSSADTLSRLGFALFDRPKELVWVVNMFKFQGSGQKNTLSAAYHLAEDIHNSFLIDHFLKRYPNVADAYKNRVSKFGTPDSRSLNPELRILIPENREEERDAPPHSEDPEPIFRFGEFGNVRMTEKEHAAVKAKLGDRTDEYIKRLDEYARIKPKKFKEYKDHHLVLMNWFGKDSNHGSSNGNFETRADRIQRRINETTREIDQWISSAAGDSPGPGDHSGAPKVVRPRLAGSE